MSFNPNEAPADREAWWDGLQKWSDDVATVAEREVVVLEAFRYPKHDKDTGEITNEMVRLSLGVINSKTGDLSNVYIERKLKNGSLEPNGEFKTSAVVWNAYRIAYEQNKNFLNDPVEADLSSQYEQMKGFLMPNFKGIRFRAQFVTTSCYNGYNVLSINLFAPDGRSGKEIQKGIAAGSPQATAYAKGIEYLKKQREKYVSENSTQSTNGFANKQAFSSQKTQAQTNGFTSNSTFGSQNVQQQVKQTTLEEDDLPF